MSTERIKEIEIDYFLTVCRACGRIINKHKGTISTVILDYCCDGCEDLFK